MARRDYAGGAVTTTITSTITGSTLTIPIADSTGWPVGTNGAFWVVMDRGLASEEKVLVLSRSGLNLTVNSTDDRGADGTTAQGHASGSSISHCIAALDIDEANAHVNNNTDDVHTQYQKESEKAAASGYASLDGSTKVPIAQLPTGSSSSTVAIGNDARLSDTRTPTDASVTAAKLASDAVTTIKILDANVTLAKQANLAASKIIGRATASTGVPEAVGLSSDLEMSGGNLRNAAYSGGDITKAAGATSATIGAGKVTQAMVNAEAETSYTPTVGVWGIGNGTAVGSYVKYGRMVVFRILITFGSTSTSNTALTLTAPFQAASTGWKFVGEILDSSTSTKYPMIGKMTAGSNVITCLIEKRDAGDFVFEVDIASASPLSSPFTSDTVAISGAFIADS